MGNLSTSWRSLAIMLVMDHSITRKIRFPAFSSLPPLQVVRKYLIFGLVGANLFARSGVIMETLLWVSDCIRAMGLLRTILTEKVNKNNLATRHSPGEGLVANRNAGRF